MTGIKPIPLHCSVMDDRLVTGIEPVTVTVMEPIPPHCSVMDETWEHFFRLSKRIKKGVFDRKE